MLRLTPSHLNTSLSGSPTTPVSSAISEFGILKVEAGRNAGQHFVLFDRDIMGLCDLDDLLADAAAALGDDARRARLVVVQRDRELALCLGAHNARSRKCPAGAGFDCSGAPSRITMSPG